MTDYSILKDPMPSSIYATDKDGRVYLLVDNKWVFVGYPPSFF